MLRQSSTIFRFYFGNLLACLRVSVCYPLDHIKLITSLVLCMSFFIFFHDIHFWYSVQGFPNRVKGWGKSPQWEGWKILLNFFIGWWESEGEWIWSFQPFLKLKTTCCKYWTLIKIKISMTCVYKEYEVKIKRYRSNYYS